MRRSLLSLSAIALLAGCSGPAAESAATAAATAPQEKAQQSYLIPKVEVTPLQPGQIPAAMDSFQYGSAEEALRSLSFAMLDENADQIPEEFRTLMTAIRQVSQGHYDQAAETATRLQSDRTAEWSLMLRARLLFNAGKYKAMRDLVIAAGGTPDPYQNAMAELPRETYSFAPQAVANQLTTSIVGQPMVEVLANGKSQQLLLDTGATLTVLNQSLATELGARLVPGPGTAISTSTSITVEARYGWLDELRIGNAIIKNHPVLVLEDKAMDWTLPDGRPFSLKGAIGWNAIRNLRIELDFPGGRYLAEKPRQENRPVRNFFWLGYPLVRLTAANGQSLLFGYDSGSRNTSFSGLAMKKLTFGSVRKERQQIGGAGGVEEIETDVVDRLSLVITGHRFDIADARREEHEDSFFLRMDGVIGSDIARRCKVIIDFANAYYGIQLSPSAR